MFRIVAISIEMISAGIFLVPILLVLQKFYCKNINLARRMLLLLFAAYTAAVFSAVGIPSIQSLTIDLSFNLIPIADIVNNPLDYLKNTALNMILFIPFGFFVPLLWKELRSLKKTALIGFGMSLLIELVQIVTFRLTDVDDLITNTIGTVIGYFILIVLTKKWKSLTELCDGENTYGISELFVISAVTFAVMFLVQPFISGFIWDMIL